MLRKSFIWALRDIRGSWKHFRLVLLCLIVTLTAITAVQVTGANVLQSIHRNAKVILGGDWVIREVYQPVQSKEREWLHQQRATLTDTAEMRAMLVNPLTSDASLVELKAVTPSYPLYGKATVERHKENFYSTLEKGLVLDRALGERLNLKIGDKAQLGDKEFTVADFLDNEPDRAGGGRFGLAPRLFIRWKDFSTTGLEQPGSLVYYDLRVRFPDGTDTVALKQEFMERFKDATWRLTDTERASPQIQRYVNNIVQFLTLIGLSALLVGGIGIANGIRAYLQTRLTSIAIFKAIGLQGRDIRLMYLWQIAAIGIAGIGAGVTLSALIPLWIAPYIQNFLPFPLTIALDIRHILIPLSFGVLTTLIFALWPLGEAEQTSPLILFRNMTAFEMTRPKPAIIAVVVLLTLILSILVVTTATDEYFALFFTIGALVCFGVFHSLGLVIAHAAKHYAPHTTFLWRMALHNMGRKGNATSKTLVSLGIGLTVLVAIASIDVNLRATLKDNMPKDAPSFFFFDIQPDQKDKFVDLVSKFPTASHIVVTPNLRGRLISVNGKPAQEALIDKRESWLLSNDRGFTYATAMPAHSTILEGKWWPKDYKGPPLVSVVDDVQRGFGVKPGDTLEVQILGRRITTTIANIREVNWTNFTVNFAMTFAPGVLEDAPHSWLATVVADRDKEIPLQREVTKTFPNISMIRLADAIDTVNNLLGQMNQAVRIMALLALFTGMIVLVETLVATRMQRIYDTVILKVIGAPRRLLNGVLLIEFSILGFAAAIVAILFGTVISWSILDLWMDLSWRFYPTLALQAALIGWGIILITGYLSLRQILHAPAIQHLRNE